MTTFGCIEKRFEQDIDKMTFGEYSVSICWVEKRSLQNGFFYFSSGILPD